MTSPRMTHMGTDIQMNPIAGAQTQVRGKSASSVDESLLFNEK